MVASYQYQYLCSSWQGLLQMVIYLCGQGYHFHNVTYFPVKKQDKWLKIDQKLINKYKTNKNKWQRVRQKNIGLANFMYMRWENIAIIMHTLGDVKGLEYDDTFFDIRVKPMRLRISELVEFEIYSRDKGDNKGYTCKLTNQTYDGFKEVLRDVARLKNVWKMKTEFDRINGIPAWAGVIEQKRQLAKYLVKQAKKHQVVLNESYLRFVDKRKPVKVWAEEKI